MVRYTYDFDGEPRLYVTHGPCCASCHHRLPLGNGMRCRWCGLSIHITCVRLVTSYARQFFVCVNCQRTDL